MPPFLGGWFTIFEYPTYSCIFSFLTNTYIGYTFPPKGVGCEAKSEVLDAVLGEEMTKTIWSVTWKNTGVCEGGGGGGPNFWFC